LLQPNYSNPFSIITGLSASTSNAFEPISDTNCTSNSDEFGKVLKYENSTLSSCFILSHLNEYFA